MKIKKIQKIENTSKRYDIEVENNNNFFANNILVHNSSFTQYVKKDENGNFITGICSRSQEKKLEQSYANEYVDGTNRYHKYIHPETKQKGWFCPNINDFKTDEEVSNFTPIMIEVKDSWIELSKSSGLFEKGMKYCINNDIQLVFRGEIYGQGLKGSGNKLNPDSNSKQTLRLFGIDSLEKGFSERLNYSSEHNLTKVCEELNLEYTKSKVIKPSSFEELCKICDEIFKEHKDNGKVIEGVVIRTMYTNDLSCKYMNPEYDSKK